MHALSEVLSSGKYAEGSYTKRLEEQVALVTGTETAVSFNSCGSALYAMYRYMHYRGTRHIAVQNNTFYATGAMAQEAGLQVYLVDSSQQCPSMSVDSLRTTLKVHSCIEAVVLTHVGGWLAKDYEDIAQLCEEQGVFLVEDCAHAMGVSRAGYLGHASCWSFYPTKAVPAGEGGVITTNDWELSEWVRLFSSYGKQMSHGKILYQHPGFNIRMSEWDAAVASVQMTHMLDILNLRAADAEVLHSCAIPCLLEGQSNYYKYPVDADLYGKKFKARAGAVYAVSDQLLACLPKVVSEAMPFSTEWAMKHFCLPIGEGFYRGKSTEEVLEMLER